VAVTGSDPVAHHASRSETGIVLQSEAAIDNASLAGARRVEPISMPELGIVTRSEGDAAIRLMISGEIDGDTAAQLVAATEETLACHRASQVIIDLAAVTFLDSAGLRTLLTAQRVASEHGTALRIDNAGGAVLRVLEVTGLLAILDGPEQYPKGV
jgi:anti-anti-sigma factor